MKHWMEEDWIFRITVLRGEARQCRIGLEQGDSFTCTYACPGDFCPKTMPVLHTLCEIIRCGGDFRLRGSSKAYAIEFPCADGPIIFRLEAEQITKGSASL